MPLYDFICDNCGKLQEHLIKLNDEELPDCIDCGSQGLSRQPSVPALLYLLGEGVYTPHSRMNDNE